MVKTESEVRLGALARKSISINWKTIKSLDTLGAVLQTSVPIDVGRARTRNYGIWTDKRVMAVAEDNRKKKIGRDLRVARKGIAVKITVMRSVFKVRGKVQFRYRSEDGRFTKNPYA